MVATAFLLGGSVPALPTPFREDAGLDETALARLAERAVAHGSAAVVVCGSTGEAAAMRPEEQARALRVVADAVGRRVPVIAGVGAPCAEAAVAFAVAAERCGAAAALLVSAPPYVKPGQEGLRAHLRAVAAAAGLPVVPSRAGVAFADETVARPRDDGAVHALKDATADLARPVRLRRLRGPEFPRLPGGDAAAAAAAHLAMGGSGCVPVTADPVPAPCAALQAAWAARGLDRVAEPRDALAPLGDALFAETDPVPAKAALALLGLCGEAPRLPLTRAAEAARARPARAMMDGLAPLEGACARAAAPGARPMVAA